MNKKNRKGFTIVELVIVIAVIAILATVLVPTFGNVIGNAKKTAAIQEARNMYTNYVMENVETGYTEDLVMKVGKEQYCAIVDGAVVDEVYTTYALAQAPVTADVTEENPITDSTKYELEITWDTEAADLTSGPLTVEAKVVEK